MTEREVVTPECLYHHLISHSWMVLSPLFVTPEIFKPGSTVLENQRKSKNLDSR